MRLFNWSSFFLVLVITATSLVCRADNLEKIHIEDLHPTQSFLGMREVRIKTRKIDEMDKEERKDFLKKEAVPVIIGPGQKLYSIDHHHLARAVLESGHEKVYIQVIADKSEMSAFQFWNWMKMKSYVYLKNEKGQAIEVGALPKSIGAMKNDSFRSLAGEVRDRGGFEKTKKPFMEFEWALFFRRFISPEELSRNFDAAAERAVKLSHSEAAAGLPGYRPRSVLMCSRIF